MPMMPGPLAAATYAAVKVVGYAGFAKGLNHVLDMKVHRWKFGAAKTAIGLAGGLTYMYLVLSAARAAPLSDVQLLAGALPVRLIAWWIALVLFYRLSDRPKLLASAVFLGALWSYILDGLMAVFYHLPGMQMGIC